MRDSWSINQPVTFSADTQAPVSARFSCLFDSGVPSLGFHLSVSSFENSNLLTITVYLYFDFARGNYYYVYQVMILVHAVRGTSSSSQVCPKNEWRQNLNQLRGSLCCLHPNQIEDLPKNVSLKLPFKMTDHFFSSHSIVWHDCVFILNVIVVAELILIHDH